MMGSFRWAVGVLACSAGSVLAGIPWACAPAAEPDAAATQHLLQFTARVQAELTAQGPQAVALVSRSGLNLQRLGHTLSHAGWGRPGQAAGAPWQVRQLYFDCATEQPRVFEEGLPGFIRGVSQGGFPRISAVVVPPALAASVANVLDSIDQLQALVAPRYQANAAPDSAETQNCNQWAVEVLAVAEAALNTPHTAARVVTRAEAQADLQAAGYRGTIVTLPYRAWMWAAAVWPQVGWFGHSKASIAALQFTTSLPAGLEAWVLGRWPASQRVEWCLVGTEVRQRRGAAPFDADCTMAYGDERFVLDP